MLKEKKTNINIFVLSIVAILGISLATPVPVEAALDINGIYMTSCKDHLDYTPITDPWVFEVWVNFEDTGSLHRIDITPFGESSFTISEDDGDWEYESPTDYLTLDALQLVYPTGDYTFEFRESDGTLLNSVTLDYSGISEPDNPVNFTYPADNFQTDIDINPTFEWTVDSGAGHALGLWLWDEVTHEDKYWDAPVPMDTLDWTPGPLEPSHDYDLEVSVFRIKDPPEVFGLPITTGTIGDDEFTYALMMEHLNEIEFTTVPEPATIALLGVGTLSLLRRKRK